MLYTIIVPTYLRPTVLMKCMNNLINMKSDINKEIRIYDNGNDGNMARMLELQSANTIELHYTENEPGHGLGYSLMRGVREALGDRIIELNDDALVPPDFLTRLDAIFDSDPRIGVVGVRAIEDQYVNSGEGIGTFDSRTGEVIGNFNRPTKGPIDVEHVYGFCYAYRREVVERGGVHDHVLLAKDYSSGNRLETDHCLTAKRLGFRVVYDGSLAVRHLAKPRADMSERSLKWKLNHTRNTLYLYLKHFGLFGRKCMALRFAFLQDVGLISLLRRPGKQNWDYFAVGIRARSSAFFHYLRYLLNV